MDIRKASKPRLVSTQGVGTTAPRFETGGDGTPTVTPAKKQELTPAALGTGAATPEPVDNYRDDDTIDLHRAFLKDRGIEETTIMSVLDMLMTGQEVLWRFELLGKIPVTFRVRPQWVDRHLIEEMERLRPTNMARFTDLVGTINLSGSLEQYMEHKFNAEDVEGLKEVSAFLGSLPFVIQNKLVDELSVFDRVIIVATSDWAVKNFSKPL